MPTILRVSSVAKLPFNAKLERSANFIKPEKLRQPERARSAELIANLATIGKGRFKRLGSSPASAKYTPSSAFRLLHRLNSKGAMQTLISEEMAPNV
jgi:hypothetical protein